MELAIPIAVVAVVLGIPVIFLLLRVLKTTGELRQLDTELAAKMQELEHTKAQLESAGADSAAAQELRIEVAGLQQQLNDKTELLARADASIKDLETKRDELQTQVANLGKSGAQLTEELKNERSALGGAKESLESAANERDQYRIELEQTRIREGKVNAELTTTQELLVEREELLKQAEKTFKVLSTQTLEQQQKVFMESADANLKEREAAVKKLVDPLREQIERFGQQRSKSEGELGQQIRELSSETTGLASALRRPEVRGQWGEIQLERVLELSRLRKGIDYSTQDSFETDTGKQRTDVIVHMPHERKVVLDSKVSLSALMDASATDSAEEKSRFLELHVEQVKKHIKSLAEKRYWRHLGYAPDVVVMVLPEFAFLAALEREPNLPEQALEQDVIIVTPPAVLALLRAVELNWQQIRVAETAEKISAIGRDLHDDLVRYAESFAQVGRGLRSAVNGYDRSAGAFKANVLKHSAEFEELGLKLGSGIEEMPEMASSMNKLETRLGPVDDDEIDSDVEAYGVAEVNGRKAENALIHQAQ